MDHQLDHNINVNKVMLINLISDTDTKPTPHMLEAMMNAEVGDDVFKMDPTVNDLQRKAAAYLRRCLPSCGLVAQSALNRVSRGFRRCW